MRTTFDRVMPLVLAHEGGWADHPSDPGGATMKGITIGTYAAFKGRKVTKTELRAITDAEVNAIYRRRYWDRVRGDDLPAGLDYATFDAAVNSGPARAAKWLQAAVGAKTDGAVGPATVAAAAGADAAAAIRRLCDARRGFVRRLQTYGTFGRGWERRIDAVEREALRLAAGRTRKPVEPQPAAPQGDGGQEQEGLWAALLRALRGIFGRKG